MTPKVERRPDAREFASYPLLSRDECTAVSGELDTVSADWCLRWGTKDWLATLGATGYLDLVNDRGLPTRKYYWLASKYNPILREHFAPLHARVREALAEILAAPVRLAPDFALPGFHIFGSAILAKQPSASPCHFDNQHHNLDHSFYGEPDLNDAVSYNVLIEAPPDGAGLRLWDLFAQDVDRAVAAGTARGYRDLEAWQTFSVCRYGLGRLNVHSSHQMHQVAPTEHVAPDTRRITLQGHALRYGAEWLLYW